MINMHINVLCFGATQSPVLVCTFLIPFGVTFSTRDLHFANFT